MLFYISLALLNYMFAISIYNQYMISILFDLCEFQYAVLYSGKECLGGSIISHVGPSHFVLNRENCIGELNAINK